jgi:hypothetical protein
MTVSSPTGQLAVLTSRTLHAPSCSTARKVRPAQFGQSKVSPFSIPAGIAISWPQPGHQTFWAAISGIVRSSGQAEQSLESSAVEPDHGLAVDHRDRRCTIPERLQFFARFRIGSDVLRDEGDTFLRKKLFLVFAARSAGLGIDDHLLCHADPPLASSRHVSSRGPIHAPPYVFAP